MSTSLASVRAGLAANLAHLNDAGGWIKVSPYQLASPSPPTIQVFPSKIDYDLANSRGGDVLMFVAQAFVSINFDIQGQVRLDQLLEDSGEFSVKEWIESDSTLGGVVDDLRVTENTGYQVYALAGRGPVLGADWVIEILTSSV